MSAHDVLVLAQLNDDAVADVTFELLAAARELAGATGGQVVALVLGSGVGGQAETLSAADRIVVIDDPQLANYVPNTFVSVLESIVGAETPRAVLIGSTSIGLDVGPMLGAKLKAPVVNGCLKLAAEGDTLKITASICSAKLLADLTVSASPAILMMLPGAYRPSEEKGAAQVETQPSPVLLEEGPVVFQKMIAPEGTDIDITQQDVLVAVGRGVQQQENMEIVEELAEVLGGAVAASRPIVDQGWLPTTRQVGKSGMTVKPKCFIALGISGAPEHVEGMKASDLIIAVNTDPLAPIFEVAHYGVVADMLDVAPALTEALGKD